MVPTRGKRKGPGACLRRRRPWGSREGRLKREPLGSLKARSALTGSPEPEPLWGSCVDVAGAILFLSLSPNPGSVVSPVGCRVIRGPRQLRESGYTPVLVDPASPCPWIWCPASPQELLRAWSWHPQEWETGCGECPPDHSGGGVLPSRLFLAPARALQGTWS